MKRLALVLAFALACSHPHHVEKGSGDGTADTEAQPKKSEGGAAAKPRAARRPQRPGRPPLAASPGGLFVPGGVGQVQKALASRGYLLESDVHGDDIDAKTAAAIRKFQSDQGIARTGNPDHETVRRLGLDADKLFRKSSAKQDQSE